MGPISRDLRMLPYGALVWQESRAAELHTEIAATVAVDQNDAQLADVGAVQWDKSSACCSSGHKFRPVCASFPLSIIYYPHSLPLSSIHEARTSTLLSLCRKIPTFVQKYCIRRTCQKPTYIFFVANISLGLKSW